MKSMHCQLWLGRSLSLILCRNKYVLSKVWHTANCIAALIFVQITGAALSLIEKERNGQTMNNHFVGDVLDSYVQLGKK